MFVSYFMLKIYTINHKKYLCFFSIDLVVKRKNFRSNNMSTLRLTSSSEKKANKTRVTNLSCRSRSPNNLKLYQTKLKSLKPGEAVYVNFFIILNLFRIMM